MSLISVVKMVGKRIENFEEIKAFIKVTKLGHSVMQILNEFTSLKYLGISTIKSLCMITTTSSNKD